MTTSDTILAVMNDIARALTMAYMQRRCFICGELGPCGHREADIELALMARITKRQGAA